jgi:hypothetical protein
MSSKLFMNQESFLPRDQEMFGRGGMPMQARGLGGDIGRHIGDWIQSALGFRRGGRVASRSLGGELGNLYKDIKERIGVKKRGGRMKKHKK